MTKTLLASAALIFAIALPSFAAAPAYDKADGFKAKSEYTDIEAKRRKKRVPGGSGCDDPRDLIEHPECKPAASMQDDKLNNSNVIEEAKRRKKRIPGGSGCDDPRDVIEHPECKPAASLQDGDMNEADELQQEAKRRKKRVPGGSGCDDPRDVIEHPECRV